MTQLLEYSKITDARAAIGDIYSAAADLFVVSISRENEAPVSVIRKDSLKTALRALVVLQPEVRFSSDGAVSMWIADLPVSAQGASMNEAEDGLIEALRDYSATWMEELKDYPNHKNGWALANLIQLSADDELHEILFGNE